MLCQSIQTQTTDVMSFETMLPRLYQLHSVSESRLLWRYMIILFEMTIKEDMVMQLICTHLQKSARRLKHVGTSECYSSLV